MTPPQKTEPSPTLLEDLEAVAADEDEAANHPYCDPEPHRKYALRATRLRSAAARLRDALESVDKYGGCTDGGCLIRKPKGQHTNGGCKCFGHSSRPGLVPSVARLIAAVRGPQDVKP